MDRNLKEVIEEHYEPTDEEGWFVCQECGLKVYASESRAEDLALHELREHPKR